MKTKLLTIVGASLLAVMSFGVKADTLVAGFGAPPSGSSSCSWQLTSSSGGGGAPQFYTLNCTGTANVVSLMTVGGGTSATCTLTSGPKAGYRTEGTGCATKIYKVSPVVIPPTGAIACTSPNKGTTYYSGPAYIANSILSSGHATTYCGDCKVLTTGLNGYYNAPATIKCSIYTNM